MSMRFERLAATLEALEAVSGRTQMIIILAVLLKEAEPDEIGRLVYLSQGRLLPDFIQEEFGMNERLIFRSIALAYNVPHEDVQARFKDLGDAGLVAQVFAAAAQASGEAEGDGLSLKEVYD